jgi:small nuclear ribonucleoprotein (snRNP)-like protein
MLIFNRNLCQQWRIFMNCGNLSSMIIIARLITGAFLIFSCHSTTKPTPSTSQTTANSNYNNLQSDSLISIQYKIVSERRAFGFDDRNNNKKYLAELDGYDENKNLIDHLTYRPDGHIEQHVVYVYENGLLINEYRLNIGGAETLYKTTYRYNPDKKLISATIVNFERRLKKDTPKWKDNLDESDFEKNKSWGEERTTMYTYDSKGRLVKTHETSDFSDEEIETFKYHSEGRVIEELTTKSGDITRKITTKYFTDSLEATCIFYPYESGNICKKTFDKNNNLLVEQCIETDSQKPMFTRKCFYDSKKRVTKEEYITNLGIPILTLYDYKENPKPLQKIFTVNNK